MSKKVHLDFETRSTVPFGLSKDAVTAYQYARHPTTGIWCLSYAFDDDPVVTWTPNKPFPSDLLDALSDGYTFAGHNVTFEWCIWNFLLVPRLGLPRLPFTQLDCTATRAAVMALPRDLAGAGAALGLPVQKDKEGSALMKRMAKPRKPRKDEDPNGVYWWDDEERVSRLVAYCERDVESERALDKVLRPLSEDERAAWLLDHKTNFHGVLIDTDFAQKAKYVMGVVERRYNDDLRSITGGRVGAVTEVAAMKSWLNDKGVDVESLDKTSVDLMLKCNLDDDVKAVLHIRQEAGKSSVAKLDRFITLTSEDGRMRENFMHHGANTGRLAGKGAQLQNLPSRGGLKWKDAEKVIGIVKSMEGPQDAEWAADMVELIYGSVPTAISSCLRGTIMAPPGKRLFVADYSNIEGRVAAWLGGEKWKLEAFKKYDTLILGPDGRPMIDKDGEELREGPDLYKVTAGQILGKTPHEVSKSERNVLGKVPELACLSAETKVLTKRGYLDIIDVLTTDVLWDGQEWVTHSGVIARGNRKVVSVDGVEMTADHLVTCGSSWQEAWRLASNRNILIRALEHASAGLRSQAFLSEQPCPAPGWSSSDAIAARKATGYRCTAYSEAQQSSATLVPRLQQRRIVSNIFATLTRLLTTDIAAAFSTVFQRLSGAATTRNRSSTIPTAGAESRYATSGARTNVLSYVTFKTALGGTILPWRWTGLTSTGGMNRVTSGLSANSRTRSTSDESTILKLESENSKPVYDILNAGPRNRFTVKTQSGHLVVHNCGFGGGVGAFTSMAKLYGINMADYWSHIQGSFEPKIIDRAHKNWDAFGSRSGTFQDEWLASEAVKLAWRDRHPGISGCWYDAEECATKAIRNPGKWYSFAGGKCAFGAAYINDKLFLISRLPSGRKIYRADVRLKVVEKFGRPSSEIRFKTVDAITKQWVETSTYGGDLFQSYVQAIACDIMRNGWKNVEEDGFDVVLSVHDEVGAEGDEDRTLDEFVAGMERLPPWADGCPVSAAGYVAQRYRKE